MDLSVASVRGLWAGTVVRVDADSLRIAGSGEPGTVDLLVRADPARTVLTVEGTVGGALVTVGSAVLAAAVRRLVDDTLAAAAPPRGTGFHRDEAEAMGSGSGTHDLARGVAEPDASDLDAREGSGSRRRAVDRRAVDRRAVDRTAVVRHTGPVAAAAGLLAGLAAVVVLGRRRRRARRRARG
jgi:hypothetical protein